MRILPLSLSLSPHCLHWNESIFEGNNNVCVCVYVFFSFKQKTNKMLNKSLCTVCILVVRQVYAQNMPSSFIFLLLLSQYTTQYIFTALKFELYGLTIKHQAAREREYLWWWNRYTHSRLYFFELNEYGSMVSGATCRSICCWFLLIPNIHKHNTQIWVKHNMCVWERERLYLIKLYSTDFNSSESHSNMENEGSLTTFY